MSSCTNLASGALPVSTRTRPSPVANADTLAKDGQKPTPSVISTNPPTWSTGWKVAVESSPFQSRSARARMSAATGHVVTPARALGSGCACTGAGSECTVAGSGCRRAVVWPTSAAGGLLLGRVGAVDGGGRAVGRMPLAEVPLAEAFLPSSRPFSNSFLAEPRFRANLGMAATSEEEHDEDDGHDQQVRTENVSEHVILLHPGPRGGAPVVRLDPIRRRAAGTPNPAGTPHPDSVRSHPASRMPITSAAMLARPPTDPHNAS